MKVRIIQSDTQWILGKFASRLCESLNKLGVDADIGRFHSPSADINHYPVHNHPYDGIKSKHDTYMITHVNSEFSLNFIRRKSRAMGMGICMSQYTLDFLVSLGIPRNKLCYINPAHDGIIKPRKYNVGLLHKVHSNDVRKRESFLLDIVKDIDRSLFRFTIMGEGWDDIVLQLRNMGVEVEYYNRFDYTLYMEHVVPSLDYYLYFGTDEGSMGYLDALAAGVETIVTPQGYHLDAVGGLTYPCNELNDYLRTFDEIAAKKRVLMDSVKDWTWDNFARKHLEVWHYLLGDLSLDELYQNRGLYVDGIFSVFPKDIRKESTFGMLKRKLPGIVNEYLGKQDISNHSDI